jgi:hypothetical protein
VERAPPPAAFDLDLVVDFVSAQSSPMGKQDREGHDFSRANPHTTINLVIPGRS